MRRWMVLPISGALLTSVACTDAGGPPSADDPEGADHEDREEQVQRSAGEPEVLTTDLETPWGLDFLPDGTAVVTERDSAQLLRVDPDGTVRELATIEEAEPGGEGGLLGVAVSPDFVTDSLLYLYHTTPEDNRIVRMTYEEEAPGDDGPDMGEPEVVLSGIPQAANHNGGRIAFGPDEMLYVGTGDAAEPELAQDTDSLAGKVLRMTAEGEPAPDNPFDNHVYSYGHRNVQGLAWDDEELYAVEFGPDVDDEVNRIEAGQNYGWPEVTGVAEQEDYVDPVLVWEDVAEASPSGGTVVGGSIWVAALRGERLWQLPLTDGAADAGELSAEDHFVGDYGRLRSVQPTPEQDALWVMTSNRDGRGDPETDDDRILRIPLE
ncbi:PQQ-dependent sugar dehydrogenase [Lipingzhangella rawalii]